MNENLTPLSKTLFIGLGGFGCNVIVNLKAQMLETYGETPPLVSFLGIDTDSIHKISCKNKLGETIVLDNEEFVHLTVPDVKKLVEENPDEYDFLTDDYTRRMSEIFAGTAGHRMTGRLAFLANQPKVERAILQAVSRANRQVDEEKYKPDYHSILNIHVIFSLAGGTGSGMFTDFALWLKGAQILFEDARLNTIGLLPIDFSDDIKDYQMPFKRKNALAAITEYEFICDGILSKLYPDPKQPARNLQTSWGLYPISNWDVYHSFTLLSKEIGIEKETCGFTEKQMTKILSSFLINHMSCSDYFFGTLTVFKLGQSLRGKMHRYLGFGYAEMVFEPNQVASYYSLLKANSISNNLLKATTEQKSITDEVQFCFDEWKIQEDNNRDDVIDFLAEPKPKQRFAGVSEFDESSATAIKSKRKTYIKGLKESLNKNIFDSQGTLDQIIGRSLNNIQSFTSEKINKQGGLNYLKELLPNMIGRFKGMMDEMTEERKEFENQLSRYENTYNTKLSEIEDAANIPRYKVFASRRKRIEAACDEYVGVVNSEATCIHEIERRTAAMAFYRKMIDRAETILNSIISFEDRVRKVIESTSKQIQKIKNRHPKEPFSIDITPEYIRSMILFSNDVDMEGFLNSVKISDVALWHHLDASELFDIITGYTNSLSKTKNYKNMTLLDALEHIPEESVLELFTELKESCELLRRLDPDYAIWHATNYEIRVSDIDHPAIIDRNTFKDILKLGEFEDPLKDSDPKLESEETDTADEVRNNTKKSPGDIFRKVFELHGRSPELGRGNFPDKITVNLYQSSVPAFLYSYFEENACELNPESFSNKHWAEPITQSNYTIFPKDAE